MNNSLADKLPIWHFDQNMMVFSDGSLGAGFKLQGIDISCASINTVNDFNKNLESLLTSIPEGLSLQVFYRLTPKVSDLIKKHSLVSSGSCVEQQEVTKARIHFLNKTKGEYFSPEIYLFLRSQPFKYKHRKLWQSEEKFQCISGSEYNTHRESFDRSVRQLFLLLNNAGLDPRVLENDKWFALLFEYFNLSRSEKVGLAKWRPNFDLFAPSLVNQILLTDVGIYDDGIKCGDYFFQVITMKNLPEGQTHAALINTLLKLPFHFWLAQNINVHKQKLEVDKLQIQRRLAHSMASGHANISDLESESKLHQIEELIRELLEGSEKLVSTDLNVIVWAKEKGELIEKSDEVLNAFKYMNQSEGVVETLPSFEAFCKTFPGSAVGLRPKNVKSSNAAHLMPLYSYWRGNKKPICLFPNRDGVLFSIDPFAKELPNWNALVFGGSGAGKSFTISQMMLQFCTQTPKPKIIWIDNGASSQRLLEVQDGEFINLGIDSKIRLNMFDLQPGQSQPSPSKVKLILAVLESILKDEERKGLPKREKALLEEAIFKTYETTKGRIPILSDLKKVLDSHSVPEMKHFSQILYSWTGHTAYGRLLDGPSNVKLTKDLITIEMKGLDTYPDLQNVFLLLFTDFIRNEAARDLSTPYLLIIDEAWKLFETPSGLSFALEAYRTFRKFNGGIWCISQNYKDFLSNQEIKNAIFPNTTSVFILRQKKIDWKDFQEALDFNDDEVEVIKSLTIEKGQFSEFFFMQDENKAVIRLTPDPLSYWICTTDGFDKAVIEQMEGRHPDLNKLEILKKLAFVDQKEIT